MAPVNNNQKQPGVSGAGEKNTVLESQLPAIPDLTDEITLHT